MSEKRSMTAFLVTILAPLVLILIGAGLASAGLSFSWMWMVWTGLVVAVLGLVWGLALMFVVGEPLV